MATQVAEMFVKVGAKIGEFNQAMISVETKVLNLSRQLKLDVKANPASVLNMQRELKTLAADAKRLQSGVLNLQVKNADPAAIKAMDDQLAGVTKRMQVLNAAIADQQQKWHNLAAAGNKLTMGITAPILAAATALGAFAVKTGELAEQLDNMSKQTGLNKTTLQELKFIADQSGLSFEAVANASTMVQRKLMGVEQDTGNVAEAFKRLGVNARGSDGQLRNMNDLFPELIAKLQAIGNATERTMLATQVFGRGANDILPILAMSAAEFENAKNKAHEFGMVLDDEALAAAARMDDAVDDLKSRFSGLTKELAMAVIPVLVDSVIPALEQTVQWIRQAAEWFGRLSPATQALVGLLLAFGAALGPILSGLSAIVIILPSLNIALNAIGLTLGRLSTYLAVVAAGIITAQWLYDRLTGSTAAQADAIRAETEAMSRNAVARAAMTREQLEAERVRAQSNLDEASTRAEQAQEKYEAAKAKSDREWWNLPALVAKAKASRELEDARARRERMRADLASIFIPPVAAGIETVGSATVAEVTPAAASPWAAYDNGFDTMTARQRESTRLAGIENEERRRNEKKVIEWERMRAEQEKIDAAYYAKMQKSADDSKQKELTAQQSAWEKATNYLQDYSDRLIGIFYGETAMRLAQFDRQRAAERKAFDESIADAALKADILAAYDEDTALQREGLAQAQDNQDQQRDDRRMDMIERLRAMTGAGSVEQLWRKMAESSLQVAFAGPQIPQGPGMIGMGGAMGGDVGGKLQRTNSTLEKSYDAQEASARSLKALERAIAGTQ